MENLKNIIIGQLNINSLRNKFYDLAELIKGKLDILVITETKLDSTFPEKQFFIPGYKKPFRADRNKDGGGVIIFVREDIPCDNLLKHTGVGTIKCTRTIKCTLGFFQYFREITDPQILSL